MATTSIRYEDEPKDMEIVKLKEELKEFVINMKSRGFLSSVVFEELTDKYEGTYID
ncbi:hypothetical protein [Sporosarcina sp. G11-34]|uniref:hypothetical protein n=1 Tax=Sporosarcina sp. G11-34 TaxID=2849605 RepID=UPI0022A910A3|nr:hypothetical protein [Sporosarcina sp. G11-34]MCZ2257401.1 hypothetical protein [Sporosarcina sp. G11-34]